VSVLNVVDGCIPSEMSTGSEAGIDEERRLLYVAMTRAKDHLELLVPQRFYITPVANPAAKQQALDLAARMRAMWK
jgi:DNA helicase-2/ATP-dependent DNA helicase PcrA